MALEDRFTAPASLSWGHFKNAEQANIRYAHAKPEGEVRGVFVHVPGYGESIEKYFEFTRDMLVRGIEVWLMEWRDQGGSDRYLKHAPQKAHSLGYEHHIDTLHTFVRDIVRIENKDKLILSAHSMGAHIGLRYLKEHPGPFDSAILTAPMLGIPTGNYSQAAAEALAAGFHFVSPEKSTADDGVGDWSEARQVFETNFKTSDRLRYENMVDICRRNENLRKGEPSFGWLHHSFASMRKLNDDLYLRSIHAPILMETSGDDKIVLLDRQQRAAQILPRCREVYLAEAKHEIWMEKDSLRNAWLSAVDHFLDERLPPRRAAAPSPRP